MKLGVITSLWAYAERLSVANTLDRIASLGIQHVDILGILHGHPGNLSQAERNEIRSRLEINNLVLGSIVLLPPGNIASSDKQVKGKCMDYVHMGIDMSAYLGGKQVLFNGGMRSFDKPHSESWKRAVDFLHSAADYAQKMGIYITVEAEPYVYFLVNDLATNLRMVQDMDHPNLLTAVDIGHMNLSRDAPGLLSSIEPWIGRIHLSENDGVLHANDILGTGSVSYKGYIEALQNSGVEVQCEGRGFAFCAVMELGVNGQRIDDPDEWARRSIAYIQGIAPQLSL